ncbi:ArnT family glycosyltransferase [Schlesneria paludicola]|uniref:ArnT family glycosyltransferase n=1 Tax=Schlesneria paludicola TaxID=360056 RepID=UPI00029A3A9B|nr:glycosyltransferase family 39 protein [Schlesneria paludicola]
MIQAIVCQRRFWLVILLALILRCGCAIAVQRYVAQNPGRLCLISGDAEGYWELAGKLAAGQEYSIYEPPRRLLRMPGFPLVLAIPRALFGDNPFAARMLLAVIGTVACGLTYWLGAELAGETVATLAGLYTAVSPLMVLFSVLFLSEMAFAAAMLASLAVLAHLVRRLAESSPSGSLSGFALQAGVLIGVATYMRPTWLLVGPGVGLLIMLFGPQTLVMRTRLAALICVGVAVTLAPWTIRNYQITHHVIPTTLWVGPSLYDGLNPSANGDSDMTFFEDDKLLHVMSEYEMDQEYRRRAWSFARENPQKTLWLALQKQIRYWSPSPNSVQFRAAAFHLVAWASYLPLLLFSLVGFYAARRDFWLLILTTAPILYFAALHLLFVGSLRYRLPAEFPLAVLAAVGIVYCWSGSSGSAAAVTSPPLVKSP